MERSPEGGTPLLGFLLRRTKLEQARTHFGTISGLWVPFRPFVAYLFPVATLTEPAKRRRNLRFGVWRSLVAHLLWEQGGAGSNPATPTSFSRGFVDFASRCFPSGSQNIVLAAQPSRCRVSTEAGYSGIWWALSIVYGSASRAPQTFQHDPDLLFR